MLGVDLEHGQVRGRVAALDVGVDGLAAVVEGDGHVVRALDNVRVGDDGAVVVHDEPGAQVSSPCWGSPNGELPATPLALTWTTPRPSAL